MCSPRRREIVQLVMTIHRKIHVVVMMVVVVVMMRVSSPPVKERNAQAYTRHIDKEAKDNGRHSTRILLT
jgi:hypothetical protein